MSRATNRLKARMGAALAEAKRREDAVAKREAAVALRDYESLRMRTEAEESRKRAALTIRVEDDVTTFGERHVLTMMLVPEAFIRRFHRLSGNDFGNVDFYAARVGQEAGDKVRRAIVDFMSAKVGGAR